MYKFNNTENFLIKPNVKQNDDAGNESTYLFTQLQQMSSYNPVNNKELWRNFFSIKPTHLLRKGNHFIEVLCVRFLKN